MCDRCHWSRRLRSTRWTSVARSAIIYTHRRTVKCINDIGCRVVARRKIFHAIDIFDDVSPAAEAGKARCLSVVRWYGERESVAAVPARRLLGQSFIQRSIDARGPCQVSQPGSSEQLVPARDAPVDISVYSNRSVFLTNVVHITWPLNTLLGGESNRRPDGKYLSK